MQGMLRSHFFGEAQQLSADSLSSMAGRDSDGAKVAAPRKYRFGGEQDETGSLAGYRTDKGPQVQPCLNQLMRFWKSTRSPSRFQGSETRIIDSHASIWAERIGMML